MSERPVVFASTNGHDWAEWKFVSKTMVCCNKCGIIRRADDKNKPCKGGVRVAFRSPPPPNPIEEPQ